MEETTSFLIRDIPVDFWRAVKIHAAREGLTLREVVQQALDQYMARQKGGVK